MPGAWGLALLLSSLPRKALLLPSRAGSPVPAPLPGSPVSVRTGLPPAACLGRAGGFGPGAGARSQPGAARVAACLLCPPQPRRWNACLGRGLPARPRPERSLSKLPQCSLFRLSRCLSVGLVFRSEMFMGLETARGWLLLLAAVASQRCHQELLGEGLPRVAVLKAKVKSQAAACCVTQRLLDSAYCF